MTIYNTEINRTYLPQSIDAIASTTTNNSRTILTAPNRAQFARSFIRKNSPKRTNEMISAWSYALHHIIKSSKQEDIAKHISKYALHPMYHNNPMSLLSKKPEVRHAYEIARERYITLVAVPAYHEISKM